ncbi:MAG: TRAP transporter large permease subunit [Proteobacteria bacterium]|nr:TRAP transporter large permease subunit [Pseudomonadota bacterium]
MTAYLDLLMFVALIGAIISGFPVAFSIAGVAVIFGYLGWAVGAMDISLLGAFSQRVFGLISNQVLIAIPLFVFMGALLDKSRVAEELLDTMGRTFGQLRGGLGIAVVLVGALLAASTGIVGATVVAMGLIALPTMLRNGYDPRVASGIVCTAGTLGQIIPPSTLLIILADVMSNAYQQAQYQQGKFAVEALSVGQFFAAALVPGLVLVGLYLLYIIGRGVVRPADMPPASGALVRVAAGEVMRAVVPPIVLIFAVLGSILGGVATPTEAASVGAIGAMLLASLRQRRYRKTILAGAVVLILLAVAAGVFPVRLQRSDLTATAWLVGAGYIGLAIVASGAVVVGLGNLLRGGIVQQAVTSTMTMTTMIFSTILAAGMFSLVFVGLGGEERVAYWLANLPGEAVGALVATMLIVFLLGFFLDFVEISVIVLPVVVPSLILLGHDPLWLGILLAINLQTSFLTPPFGFSLFYLRGAAPKEVTTGQIYRGIVPFIVLQVVGISLIYFVPGLATWLPRVIF